MLISLSILVSKRSSELHVVHIHKNLSELPRNMEISVIK